MEYLKKTVIDILKQIIEKALQLYYILKKDNVPIKAKAIIVGALAYIIFPIDVIPDFIPVLGWVDDFAVLMIVLSTVPQYTTEDIINQAKNKLKEWFE